MITKERSSRMPDVLAGLTILLVGIVIGIVARPSAWRSPPPPDADERATTAPALRPPMAKAEASPSPTSNGLDTLYVELEPEHAAKLQQIRDKSVKRGMIIQEAGELLPATVRLGDRTARAKVRIKGDFLDHVDTDKWSLRIELSDTKLMGMRRFSIQHPKTRFYLWEWLIMAAARRDGLLAPRCTFVNVVVNSNPNGIYYLEEHFAKELLESQGRREGPIVRFVDEGYWASYHQYQYRQGGRAPKTIEPSQYVVPAEINAFGEKRLAQTEALARQLQEALMQLRSLQNMAADQKSIPGDVLAKVQARADTAGEMIASIFDTDSNARLHALVCLFRCNHTLSWPNRRFYHNPITGRLEPVVYDTLAGRPLAARDPISMASYTTREFLECPSYYNHLFKHVGEIAAAGYLQGMIDDLGPELDRFAEALRAEGIENPYTDPEKIKNQLRDQQVFLQQLLCPKVCAGFSCHLLSKEPVGGKSQGTLVVEAWATTKVPVLLECFRFHNGRTVSAGESLAPDTKGTSTIDGSGAVVLPSDGRHVTFRFPIDARLASLRDVAQIKDAIRNRGKRDKSVKLRLTAEYRTIAESGVRKRRLSIRRFGVGWREEGGRPEPPTLAVALDRHKFLRHDSKVGLSVGHGVWDVSGDLVVPKGHILNIGPGVTLRFDERSSLVSAEPLLFRGTKKEPIVLEPKTGVARWAGITVLKAPGKCRWEHVHVRRTDIIQRGGWIMTGGVTFYRTPVELVDCRFENALGEDALNIYGAEFLLDRVVMDGVASDAYDGDFVTGTIRNCVFMNSVEDAVDVSGSKVTVRDCRFVNVGDKCISAGEDSTVSVRDCVAESASIAVASKDYSRVDIQGLDIRKVRNYGLAVYVKKPEYGPSTIVAKDTSFGECGQGRHIVQTPCKLTVNGQAIAGTEVDVADLYRKKILGQ